MKTISIKEKQNKAYGELKEVLGLKNIMQTPKVTKIDINVGIGSLRDKSKIEFIQERVMRIAGQKPSLKGAKKSIAAFKVREGDPVGLHVTLRGKRMFNFLDKLVYVALPRTKDFRGISTNGIDQMGNYSLGVKENTIFPETSDEELKNVFGLSVVIGTNAKTKARAKELLTYLGFPFKKVEETKKKK
jgi:large subunit ribosomal protein L5